MDNLSQNEEKDMIYQEIKDKKGSSNQPSQIRENNAHPMNRSNVMNHFVKPIVYNIVGGGNSIIRIGAHGVEVQSKTPVFPPVPIQCRFCLAKLVIPGNVSKFYCSICKELNETQPKFGLFICYMCHGHVCYPYHTSQHIYCNFCTAVNAVSINPPQKPHLRPTEKKPLQKQLRQESQICYDQNGDMATVARLQQQSIEEF